MKNLTFLLSFFIPVVSVFAQKEADFWYFGNNAGIQFTAAGPVALENGALKTDEGCSVISTKEGKLLFYTDGITVWNSMHKIMSNGAGLKGDPSSTQSSVAIPRPKHPGEYYLFTVAATAQEAGIRYSLVDTRLNGGLGEVVQAEKNVALETPVTEKLTAVAHRNGTDIWVIGHGWKNNEFIAYLVTETGVNKTAVRSKVGMVHDGGNLNTQGYMKSNPDGSNLALALEEVDFVEMFDFDNSAGTVSNPITVKMKDKSYVYGVEFSPDGSLLYATAAGTGEIYQFNLQAGSTELIQASQVMVGKSPNKEWIGAMQIAADGKIYFPIYNTPFLGTIEKPNVPGIACGVKMNTVDLKGRTCTLGLPTFTQSFFENTKNETVTYFTGTAKKGQKLVLKNVNFDFAKSTLQASSNAELMKVVAFMKANPSYRIALSGHTDNIGNKSSNLLLSQNRAAAVKAYLVAKGIAANRIETAGYGSSKPVASNSTDAGRAKNRRVEFVVL
jgi:outer membrane protein OmpA-like peptidoglycan-associated protein